ncbi:MAG: phosphatidylserine decarboxylase [Syntrophobacteraceae bacterium]
MFLKEILLASVCLGASIYLYWRYIWFFRNPPRKIPPGNSGILSPADGTIVYVKEVRPEENVVTIKKGLKATIGDITREDITRPKVLIGIFMSPLNVHYNRIPVHGEIKFVHHYSAAKENACMASMHLRTVFGCQPLYRNSVHIIQNERTVTKIEGMHGDNPLACYVVQIAAKSVSGIDTYVAEGDFVEPGQIFGMIRIGSQVDLVVTSLEGMNIRVRPGNKVRAGETILIDWETEAYMRKTA